MICVIVVVKVGCVDLYLARTHSRSAIRISIIFISPNECLPIILPMESNGFNVHLNLEKSQWKMRFTQNLK